MGRPVAERIIEVLAANPEIRVLDLTGGAPELNPSFRWLVAQARRLDRHVIDRCNLTILLEPGHEGLAEFLAAHQVRIVASLPCYSPRNVEQQRGKGVFGQSIQALWRLNELGYGRPDSGLRLDLVYNPIGAFLPPAQEQLELDYKDALGRSFGIEFHQLLTITNMPIKRFAHWLERNGAHDSYMSLLVNHFNPATLSGLMCRSLLSVGYDGRLYDCDFNQMLEIPLGGAEQKAPRTLWNLTTTATLDGRPIATGNHCFGCSSGAGSSCGGALQ
jgi:radical SAM/Cys-rich protein